MIKKTLLVIFGVAVIAFFGFVKIYYFSSYGAIWRARELIRGAKQSLVASGFFKFPYGSKGMGFQIEKEREFSSSQFSYLSLVAAWEKTDSAKSLLFQKVPETRNLNYWKKDEAMESKTYSHAKEVIKSLSYTTPNDWKYTLNSQDWVSNDINSILNSLMWKIKSVEGR